MTFVLLIAVSMIPVGMFGFEGVPLYVSFFLFFAYVVDELSRGHVNFEVLLTSLCLILPILIFYGLSCFIVSFVKRTLASKKIGARKE